MSAQRIFHRASATAAPSNPVQPARNKDLVWGRPLFKAPTLPNPRTIYDPMPFTDTRISQSQTDRVSS